MEFLGCHVDHKNQTSEKKHLTRGTVSQVRGACIHTWKPEEESCQRDVGVDYGYFGKGRQRTIVVEVRRTQMFAGTAVESHGRDDYSTSFMTAFLQSLAWQRIIHRSDNEFSLLALLTRVAMNLPCTEHGFASQSESLKDTQGRWARWNSGLADGLNRQTRLACQGEQCSVMVARWTREEEGGRPWRRLQVEFNVPKVGDQAQALVATCGPTVLCALETTNAVELRCSRQLMRSTRLIRQLVCDATTCFCRRAKDYFGIFQPERHASASGGQGRRGCRRGSVFCAGSITTTRSAKEVSRNVISRNTDGRKDAQQAQRFRQEHDPP